MPTPARALAFRILQETADPRAMPLADRLASPDAEALDPRERGFLHELVLGTLRHRGAIDAALQARMDRPLSRVDDPVLAALRLGAYQILRLRVPDRAAVSESVDLARAAAPHAKGFVNAVLRRLAREGAPAAPDPASQPLEWLTTAGSLPRWLAERWLHRLGPEVAVARAQAFLRPPPTAVRLNPRVPDAEARLAAGGALVEPGLVPGALRVSGGSVADLLRDGVVYAQDEGSQMVARLAARAGRVLDACAAPGGKTTLMADLEGTATFVVAEEIAPRRAQTLATLVRRWGATNVAVVIGDGRQPPFLGRFESVLLDAPCSGLGTLSRNPDLRWRIEERDIARNSQRQRELLRALSERVAPGGTLVYSTCSLEKEENEDVVGPFLASRPAFAAEPPPAWAERFAEGSFVRTRPERDGGDGFFAALLRRGR